MPPSHETNHGWRARYVIHVLIHASAIPRQEPFHFIFLKKKSLKQLLFLLFEHCRNSVSCSLLYKTPARASVRTARALCGTHIHELLRLLLGALEVVFGQPGGLELFHHFLPHPAILRARGLGHFTRLWPCSPAASDSSLTSQWRAPRRQATPHRARARALFHHAR